MALAEGLGPPRLSVVVACHNVEAYVGPLLQSLRRNSAPGIRFLLIDDASSDGTRSIIERNLDRMPDTELIASDANLGVSAVRNLGLANLGPADYVTFADGDDYFAPGYFDQLRHTIHRLGCDMVRTDHVQVTGRKRTIHRIQHHPRGRVSSPRDAILPIHRATSVDAPHSWAGIYHRRLVEDQTLQFDTRLRTAEDRPWIWRLHLRATSFAVVGLLGVHYRRGISTSLTAITDRRQLDFLLAFSQVVDLVLADRDVDRLLPKAIRTLCGVICRHVGRIELFEPPLDAELLAGAQAALRALPQSVLSGVLAGIDERRRTMLQKVMAG